MSRDMRSFLSLRDRKEHLSGAREILRGEETAMEVRLLREKKRILRCLHWLSQLQVKRRSVVGKRRPCVWFKP